MNDLTKLADEMLCYNWEFPPPLQEWAARIKAAAKDEWQPIETAPRDGARVLVFCPEDAAGNKPVVCAAWHGHSAADGAPIWWTEGAWLEEHEISLWRPLPEPTA